MHGKTSEIKSISKNFKKGMVRPHLNTLFEEKAKFPLIEVIAGTGYGKSYSVAAFLKETDAKVIWVQLTKLDNLMPKFWDTFVKAVQMVSDKLAEELKSLGYPETNDQMNKMMKAIAANLYMYDKVYLVMDDFYHLDNKVVIDLIEAIVATSFINMTVIVISRTDIDKLLGLEISDHDIAKVTIESLRFSRLEVYEYLLMSNISCTETEVDNIYRSTEGWPLALAVMAHHLKKQGGHFDNPTAITYPILFDLISNELFMDYDTYIQDFLIKLAILDVVEYPVALIEALAGDRIEEIKKVLDVNMFMLLDAARKTYHMHHMFYIFLIQKKAFIKKKAIDEFFLITGRWYEEEGLKIDAAIFYNKCGYYEGLWNVIINYRILPLPKETIDLFLGYMDCFPESFIQKHPIIPVVYANHLNIGGQHKRAISMMEDLIVKFLEQPETDENRWLLGEAYYSLALVYWLDQDYRFEKCFELADQLLPEGSTLVAKVFPLVNCKNTIGFKSATKENLTLQLSALKNGIPYASRVMHGGAYGTEYLAAAEAAFYQNQLKSAKNNVLIAMAKGLELEQYDIVCNSYLITLRISLAEGKYEDAINSLRGMSSYIDRCNHYSAQSFYEFSEGWFLCKVKDFDRVANWLINDSKIKNMAMPVDQGRSRIIKSMYLLSEEKFGELIAQVYSMEEEYAGKPWLWIPLLKAKIFKAFAHYKLGNVDNSMDALQEAYDMAHEIDFIMPFIECGSDMRTLTDVARQSERHTIPEAWLERINKKASTYAKRLTLVANSYYKENPSPALVKNELTSREMDILSSLCQGLTREEIADSYNISINTVKSTLKSIYFKLGAINRLDAIHIAMANRLLD